MLALISGMKAESCTRSQMYAEATGCPRLPPSLSLPYPACLARPGSTADFLLNNNEVYIRYFLYLYLVRFWLPSEKEDRLLDIREIFQIRSIK